ncbi:protein disulfide isomerase pTAC5, chloroplastic isoform X2 [Phoenix dactylifera]|uniref:Protein disulfide isomerase pTAC5, chloroplastic isoform X2 n=1 Tax=Phoenix dactylifera TaxID=42345 RepID=A0A8B7BTL3_PHODC|nr:protein disulfide isomerase pTAC5, chloroplastic isoform X2 [Phoenix dactylifera]
MASTLPLHPYPPLLRPPLNSAFLPTPFRVHRSRKPSSSPRLSIMSAAASDPSWEREEARWLREEQRWVREEQRWLREESRWNAERESLLREVAALRLRIEALERDAGGLRASVDPLPLLVEEAHVKEMVLEEGVRVAKPAPEKKEVVEEGKKKTLTKGSEGEEVRAMQEALQRLGFYSGEEDMEYSSFSSGTERAVKTWQASLGTPEDGIMTTELLERLFTEQRMGDSSLKDGANGAAAASITEIAEIQQTVVKERGDAEVQVSQRKVFLLGENRWEEPSRLVDGNKPISRSKVVSTRKCLSCRGQGRLMCTECDGSGEPNIEPQFLEWVDEGAKCPYCEGLGYTICDVCEGKTITET